MEKPGSNRITLKVMFSDFLTLLTKTLHQADIRKEVMGKPTILIVNSLRSILRIRMMLNMTTNMSLIALFYFMVLAQLL